MEFILFRHLFEEELQRLHLNRNRRVLRDESDPFSLPAVSFRQLYRVSYDLGHYLLVTIGPHMRDEVTISSIPKCLRLFATLNFFGQGSYQRGIGQDFLTTMHQTSISRCVSEVSNLIVQILGHVVRFPASDEAETEVKLRFTQHNGFPGIIGCIDCTQIAIIAPKTEDPIMPGVIFYCRKLYYSLNVQIICEPNLKIRNINARFPGSVHDSAIWQSSSVRQHLQTKFLVDNNRTSYLLGDSGYPLEPWLLTPIQRPANQQERAYNISHRAIRNIIERTNGVLKQRFRCIFKHRTLHYAPQKAAQIIYSCAILHNLCIERNDIWDIDDFEDENDEDEENIPQNDNHEGYNFRFGRNVRDMVVRRYF